MKSTTPGGKNQRHDKEPRRKGCSRNRGSQVMEHHELLSGLVRLHVLHHAAEREIYGQWMIEELAYHGYRLSAGTLYPLLYKMERDGYLISCEERDGRTVRRFYSITRKGCAGLAVAKARIREFTGEAMK